MLPRLAFTHNNLSCVNALMEGVKKTQLLAEMSRPVEPLPSRFSRRVRDRFYYIGPHGPTMVVVEEEACIMRYNEIKPILRRDTCVSCSLLHVVIPSFGKAFNLGKLTVNTMQSRRVILLTVYRRVQERMRINPRCSVANV